MKRIEYMLEQLETGQHIYIQNDYDCSKDLDKDKRKLKELTRWLDEDEYLDHVKGEGGTGIPKICQIIRKDLNKNGIIKFDLKEKEDKFFIDILIE